MSQFPTCIECGLPQATIYQEPVCKCKAILRAQLASAEKWAEEAEAVLEASSKCWKELVLDAQAKVTVERERCITILVSKHGYPFLRTDLERILAPAPQAKEK